MVAAKYVRINVYTCLRCGNEMVTGDVVDGVTPFMMTCNNDACGSEAESCFYQCDQTLVPKYEWYKPKTDTEFDAQFEWEMETFGGEEFRSLLNKQAVIAENKEHVAKGGLLLRAAKGGE